MKEQQLRVGHHRVRVREQGQGDPLLLIHGLGAHLEMWGPVEAALASRRLITMDLPGMGRSSIPNRPLHVCEIADIVEKALQRLGYEQIDVLGYSFGGAVAQTLALRHPARIRRLALVSTIVGVGSIPGSLAALATSTIPLRYWSPWFYKKSYVWTVGGPAPSAESLKAQVAMRLAAPPSLVGYAWQWLAAMTWTSLGRLERIPHPTLVISGTDDPLVPYANSINLATQIPNARLFLAEGEGHMLLFDHGSQALPALVDYFGAAVLDQAPGWNALIQPALDEYPNAVRRRFGSGWRGALGARASLGFQKLVALGRTPLRSA